ncbi:hypothetical protein [Streptomyces sp. NPDC101115]|uniref:phage tail protein n=1 Tax=Streptomyces sp. NPDC101115 TaxID=3366106 RepID=UPI00382403EC
MSALTIGDLVGYIRADGSDFERNLARSQLRMEGFRVDVNGRLRDLRGRFVRDTGIMGRALADSFSDAEREGTRIVTVFDSVADAQARTLRGRIQRVQAAARRLGGTLERVADRVKAAWDRIDFDKVKGFASQLGGVAAGFGKVGIAAGGALNVVVGLVAAVSKIAPAAAVAVSAMLAIRLASAAVKLGMVGVEDAVSAALDPSKAQEFEEALKKLAPNAQAFAREVKKLAPGFKELQQSVQNRLFEGFGESLKSLASAALPSVRRGLEKAATSLNRMARGAATAAEGIGRDGTLGKAIQGANDGLQNLENVPGRIVTGLGQLGAAAAPAFDRITKAVDRVSAEIATKLAVAYRTGKLEKMIDEAVDTFRQLLGVIGNFAKAARNIFKGLTQDGGGLFDILEKISQAFVKLTASKEFQSILNQLSMTAGTLVDAILPLLLEAFRQLAPVIEELAPVVREFVQKIGPELVPVIRELGPVLVDIAKILKEQLPFAILLTTSVLQALAIALRGVHWVLQNVVIPVVSFVADVFQSDFVQSLGRAVQSITAFTATALSSFSNFKRTMSVIWTQVLRATVDTAARMRDGLIRGTVQGVTRAVDLFRSLPGRIVGAFGNAGSLLYGAGQAVVRGFISGIVSMLGALRSQLGGITASLPDWKGPASTDARILVPAGRSVLQGFMGGIASQVPALQRQLAGITTGLPGMSMGPMTAGAGAYGGTSAAPAPIVLHLHGPGLKETLREAIREDGGNVQAVLGS